MDRRTLQATVHGDAKSQTRLSTHRHMILQASLSRESLVGAYKMCML